MSSDSFKEDLRYARVSAQQLWDQCRKSPSSYKLLSTSLKKLRNVLEDLEELEILDEAPELSPDDALAEQIARSTELLVRLETSLESYGSSEYNDVDESLVADLNTGLDVIGQELTRAHDAMSTGEIQLKLDTSEIPSHASPSYTWESPSASVGEHGQERKPSSRSSSAWSGPNQHTPGAEVNPGVASSESESDHEPRFSAEKEVYDLGTHYLQSPTLDNAVAPNTPSLDWRSPFASPDPMSISIEQASTIILKDDETLTPTPNRSRPKSATNPQPFAFAPVNESTRWRTQSDMAGLGISTEDVNTKQNYARPERTSGTANRPRSVSESIESLFRNWPSRQSVPASSALHATRSNESFGRIPIRRATTSRDDTQHLSPNAFGQEFGRRSRNNSAGSITFSTRSVETGEPAANDHNERRSAEGQRKELSVVLESDSDEQDQTTTQSQEASSNSNSDRPATPVDATTPPPPPARQPPSPPKPTKIPKIPRRPSTYRIVNAILPGESSSEEDDLYSSSKPSSPMKPEQSLDLQTDNGDTPYDSVEDQANEDGIPEPETKHERRTPRNRTTHARRVLMARAAYTQPTSPGFVEVAESHSPEKTPVYLTESSNLSPNSRKRSGENPPLLKRHWTSPVPTADRPPTLEENIHDIPKRTKALARAKSPHEDRLESFSTRATAGGMNTVQLTLPREDLAIMAEKELAPESGLEVDDLLQSEYAKIVRGSESTASSGNNTSEPIPASRAIRDVQHPSRVARTPEIDLTSASESSYGPAGWYAPDNLDTETTDITDIDSERIKLIVHFWNSCSWDQAESYLEGHLESLIEQDKLDRARRVRHLLGVCTSFKGRWTKAIPLFLSVLRSPISDISQLDDGDCAAAYWLGDAYSLLNQRTEALLAYCIAEHCSLFLDSTASSLCDQIHGEQEAVQLGVPRAEFKLLWAQESFNQNPFGLHSILDKSFITATAARTLLDNESHETRRISASSGLHSSFQLDEGKSRAQSFSLRDKPSRFIKYHRLKITSANFEPDTSWPMLYDPLFSMANVRRGRLLLYECDLLSVFSTNPEAKVPKSGPMNLSRMDCFTSLDLNWLISTIRECLRMLEMEWSEVANVEGTWFVARYSFMKSQFATTYYFSIAVFRQSLRAGYGVEICPDGICAARIVRNDWEQTNGVHNAESKRIRKLIREYLDDAAKQHAKVK